MSINVTEVKADRAWRALLYGALIAFAVVLAAVLMAWLWPGQSCMELDGVRFVRTWPRPEWCPMPSRPL